MNDPILEGEAQPQAANTNVSADGAAAEAAPVKAEIPAWGTELQQSMRELTEVVRSAAQAVSRMPAPAPAPEEPTDKFLERLASDPKGVIREVARGELAVGGEATAAPAMRTMFEAASKQLLATHRAEIDTRFGGGTYDELFKPQLEKDLAQLLANNPQVAAQPDTVQMLVDRLYGGANFAALRERERNMETARQRGIVPGSVVPGGGVPRLRQFTGDELPDDVEVFIRNVERSTGEKVDRKAYAKLYYTGQESGPGRHRTNLADYLQATGADADTKRKYLGDKQA